MAKVTSKLQVTIPKRIADNLGIRPGDELEFRPTGRGLWVIPARRRGAALSREERLRLFDCATERCAARAREGSLPASGGRGWTRDALYEERDRRGRDG